MYTIRFFIWFDLLAELFTYNDDRVEMIVGHQPRRMTNRLTFETFMQSIRLALIIFTDSLKLADWLCISVHWKHIETHSRHRTMQ